MVNNKEPRFLVDKMLGRLAKWLRVFGYDSVYSSDKFGAQLLLESLRENRILLTRGKKLSDKRGWKVIYLKSDHVSEQLKQLVEEIGLRYSLDRIFSRCTICNGKITVVSDKKVVEAVVPEYVYKTQDVFYQCENCKQLYWKGTHLNLIEKDIKDLGIEVK